MVIKIPQLQALSPLIKEEILERTGCKSVPDWEIFVQQRDDIAWSVVLSYLTSTNYRDQNDFPKRLIQLTGSNENLKSVKKAIKSFNPFKNRYSCFSDETLNQVVEEFKENFEWDSFPRVSDKLENVSDKLRCPVVSMWKDEENTKQRIYSKHPNQSQDLIILYSYEISSNENENFETVYNFLLNHELGVRMKNAALIYSLREAKMFKKQIRRIESTVNKGKHFLITLLDEACQDVIPKLYKSAYAVSKLNEAGYETDPRTRGDDGQSALIHALINAWCLGNKKELNVLYFFAANNCAFSECLYRNPDSSILDNLYEIDKLLENDLAKNEFYQDEFYQELESFKNMADHLLGLNKFLIKFHRKVINTKKELNSYESTNATLIEAHKRRDIMVSLLDTFLEFFEPLQNKDEIPSLGDRYIKFKYYYNSIDMTTAMIFFDNIVLLKERLALDDKNQYSEIESSVLLSVLYHVVFESKYVLNIIMTDEVLCNAELMNDINDFYAFPAMFRQEYKSKIEEFSKILRDTVINEDNIVKSIPESEIKSVLSSYPVYKDYTELSRLIYYMILAVKVNVKDVKSVLVIERALQVIGEYILSDKNNDHSFRRFISLVLPKDVSRILHRTRHELSHLKSYVFGPKFDCENYFSLFRSIQEEIRQIFLHLKPLFKTHNFNQYLHLMKIFEEYLERIKNEPLYWNSLKENSKMFYLRFGSFIERVRNSCYLSNKYAVRGLLDTVFCYVENDIMNEINWSDDGSLNWESLKDNVLNSLWPLKWMAKLLKECKEEDGHRLLNYFKEEIEDCNPDTHSIQDLEDNTYEFLERWKDAMRCTLLNTSREREINPLEEIKSINHFLNILKGFIYLTDEEKDEIRQEIPEKIKENVCYKEILIKSIKDGFTLEIEEIKTQFKQFYLSKKKKNLFLKYYQDKDIRALDILETPDPIFVLEEIFSKNYVGKNKYKTLCETMQFSDKTKQSLERLVAGQNKIPGNNLFNLLNRVQLLKEILIVKNGKVYNLWQKINLPTSRIHVVDTIVWYYVRDYQLQAAVEALLFDCTSIYKSKRSIANPWIKSSNLYRGINLRNVLSHGSPLLENLCHFLDGEDLPSDMIQKILQLIENEDSIKAILELYEQVHNDYSKLLSVINSEEDHQYTDIKSRITKCDDWKKYALLLPYKLSEHKLCTKSDSHTSQSTTDNDD